MRSSHCTRRQGWEVKVSSIVRVICFKVSTSRTDETAVHLSRPTSSAAAKPAAATPMSLVPAVLVRRKFREIKVHCAASTPRLGMELRMVGLSLPSLSDVYLLCASMR